MVRKLINAFPSLRQAAIIYNQLSKEDQEDVTPALSYDNKAWDVSLGGEGIREFRSEEQAYKWIEKLLNEAKKVN